MITLFKKATRCQEYIQRLAEEIGSSNSNGLVIPSALKEFSTVHRFIDERAELMSSNPRDHVYTG